MTKNALSKRSWCLWLSLLGAMSLSSYTVHATEVNTNPALPLIEDLRDKKVGLFDFIICAILLIGFCVGYKIGLISQVLFSGSVYFLPKLIVFLSDGIDRPITSLLKRLGIHSQFHGVFLIFIILSLSCTAGFFVVKVLNMLSKILFLGWLFRCLGACSGLFLTFASLSCIDLPGMLDSYSSSSVWEDYYLRDVVVDMRQLVSEILTI